MKLKNPKNIERGKKSRAAGARFELKVRKDLETKGWIVDKWSNNLEYPKENVYLPPEERKDMKLIPAKHRFRGVGIPMAIGTGFPDFICIKVHDLSRPLTYLIKFVESKMNGYLSKVEKEKCRWMIEQGFIIEIASKGEKRGEIIYKEFK